MGDGDGVVGEVTVLLGGDGDGLMGVPGGGAEGQGATVCEFGREDGGHRDVAGGFGVQHDGVGGLIPFIHGQAGGGDVDHVHVVVGHRDGDGSRRDDTAVAGDGMGDGDGVVSGIIVLGGGNGDGLRGAPGGGGEGQGSGGGRQVGREDGGRHRDIDGGGRSQHDGVGGLATFIHGERRGGDRGDVRPVTGGNGYGGFDSGELDNRTGRR